jgi:hypothetical protein
MSSNPLAEYEGAALAVCALAGAAIVVGWAFKTLTESVEANVAEKRRKRDQEFQDWKLKRGLHNTP